MKEAKSDTTHCEHLCPAGAIAPSFTCWLTVWLFSGRDLRNSSWTICTLPMSSKESGEFYSYWIRNIHTRSKYICCKLPSKEFIHTWYKLLTPHSRLRDSCWFRKKHSYRLLFYSYQIRLAHFLLKQSYRALLHAIEFNYRQVKMFIFTCFLTANWLHFINYLDQGSGLTLSTTTAVCWYLRPVFDF